MKEIKIENISLSLSNEGSSVRVKSNTENVILSNQVIDVVGDLIKHNFNIVNEHYKKTFKNSEEVIDFKDLNLVSIKIVLHYLYMYNSWKDKELKFSVKDFTNPSTHDIIFNYFKENHPKSWEKKSATLLGMGLNDLKIYYKTREVFYNK